MQKNTQENKRKYIPKLADLPVSGESKTSSEQPRRGRIPALEHIKPKTFPELLAEFRL